MASSLSDIFRSVNAPLATKPQPKPMVSPAVTGAPLNYAGAGDAGVGAVPGDASALLQLIGGLPDAVQYALLSQLGSQGNINSGNLRNAYITQRFGGNVGAFNDWLNSTAIAGGNTAQFDPYTGKYTYYTVDPTQGAIQQSGALANWPTAGPSAAPTPTPAPGAQTPPAAPVAPVPTIPLSQQQTSYGLDNGGADFTSPTLPPPRAGITQIGPGYVPPPDVEFGMPSLSPELQSGGGLEGQAQPQRVQAMAQALTPQFASPQATSSLQTGGITSPGTPLAGGGLRPLRRLRG